MSGLLYIIRLRKDINVLMRMRNGPATHIMQLRLEDNAILGGLEGLYERQKGIITKGTVNLYLYANLLNVVLLALCYREYGTGW